MQMNRIVITPIFILLVIILFFSVITTVNGLFINSGGGNSLGGGLALIFTLIISAILAAEQAIVKEVKRTPKVVWIAELLIISIAVVAIYLSGFDGSIG